METKLLYTGEEEAGEADGEKELRHNMYKYKYSRMNVTTMHVLMY